MSTMFSKKKGATTSVFVKNDGTIVTTRPTSDDNFVEVKVSMASDRRNPDAITFFFPPTHEVKKGDPLDMAVKSQVIRGNVAIANFGNANNTSDHTLVTEVYFPSAGHKPDEDAKKELAKAYNAARDVHNKAVAAAASSGGSGSGGSSGGSGSGSSGSGSGSGGSGSGGSGSGSSGSGSGSGGSGSGGSSGGSGSGSSGSGSGGSGSGGSSGGSGSGSSGSGSGSGGSGSGGSGSGSSGSGSGGSGSSGSGSGSGGSGSGGSGSGSSGSGSGSGGSGSGGSGSGSSGSGSSATPIRLNPGCNPAGMTLQFMTQQQAVDDWNRMRSLCRLPAQQFILDDGSTYPATI